MSSPERFVPERGKIVVVGTIPPCDFCGTGSEGPYDFATRFGPWAHGCKVHWQLHRARPYLGTGSAQLWITQDQVAGEPVSDSER